MKATRWPELRSSLTLTLGKGGVGKTTISAGLAYHERALQRQGKSRVRSGKPDGVAICSIDPAPSLDDVFRAKVDDQLRPLAADRKLYAAEVDATAQFRRWAAGLRGPIEEATTSEQRGLHVDLTLDRNFLLALLDIVPPGIDEIFAVFRILDLLQDSRPLIIDMAPTGHALEVLQTPARLLAWARLLLKTLAAHRTLPFARDAAVEIATMAQKVRDLAAMLQDPQRCSIVVVTLPEPLPDHETRRLLRSLERLRAPVSGIFVNRVRTGVAIAPSSKRNAGRELCARCRLVQEWQRHVLAEMQRGWRGQPAYVVPESEAPIAGIEGLQRLNRRLWQMSGTSKKK